MNDEQILREVYNRLREGKDLIGGYAVLADFIEQEWQKEDEKEGDTNER